MLIVFPVPDSRTIPIGCPCRCVAGYAPTAASMRLRNLKAPDARMGWQLVTQLATSCPLWINKIKKTMPIFMVRIRVQREKAELNAKMR
ncbi:hypothetical protein [Burkholderia cepacia]|uniref:hypothetical protein n=1 Tax=Burkholderia cepacia TaxID=292 RepID=UPI001ABAB745|nr:hypothetical protein [Burkholderia cepacia]